MKRLIAAVLLAAAPSTTGCSHVLPLLGYPPYALRKDPPNGIAQRALAAGATAPTFELPSSEAGTWALAKALQTGPVVLLFYRGDW